MTRATPVLVALALLLVAPALAETRTGKASPSRDVAFAFVPIVDGQALVTLTWSKASAELFMIMDCFDDEGAIPWGTSAALQDRVQRMDVGVLAGLECVIGVSSFAGSSKFALSVQVADDEPLVRASGAGVRPGAMLVEVDPEGLPSISASLERVRRARAALAGE